MNGWVKLTQRGGQPEWVQVTQAVAMWRSDHGGNHTVILFNGGPREVVETPEQIIGLLRGLDPSESGIMNLKVEL